MIVPIVSLAPAGSRTVNKHKGGFVIQENCKRGHALVEGNLYYSTKGRACRRCRINSAVALKQKKRKLRRSLKEKHNAQAQYPFTEVAQDCYNRSGSPSR
jgi:hypothetical protein